MRVRLSDIVISKNGRDMGKKFFVVDTEEDYVFLADGKGRRLERPKRKKRMHVSFLTESDSRAARKLRDGERVTNSEIRRALAEHEAAQFGETGGM